MPFDTRSVYRMMSFQKNGKISDRPEDGGAAGRRRSMKRALLIQLRKATYQCRSRYNHDLYKVATVHIFLVIPSQQTYLFLSCPSSLSCFLLFSCVSSCCAHSSASFSGQPEPQLAFLTYRKTKHEFSAACCELCCAPLVDGYFSWIDVPSSGSQQNIVYQQPKQHAANMSGHWQSKKGTLL